MRARALAIVAVLAALTGPAAIYTAAQTAPKLDYDYFTKRVEPIFLAKRAGHARATCVMPRATTRCGWSGLPPTRRSGPTNSRARTSRR